MTGILGIIGGSGLYEMEGMTDVSVVTVADALRRAVRRVHRRAISADASMVFLPRHGKGHRFLPAR